MAVSKVILDGSTLLDVTNSTVNSQRILSGYVAKGADGVDVTGAYVPPTFDTQAKSVTPSESQQTVTPDSGYDGLSSVTVGAVSSTYVGSGITRRSSTDLTASGATVTVPSGYYQSQASKAVSSGTAGTPTATKGSVSNHSVSVTPSVTNTAGYITGGTVSGTAVAVAASELVSGTYAVSASGTHDVTNYASASVAAGSATASATKGSVSNHSVTVTPSVTRTAGYVTAGTADGTAVTVSASELVSGTLSVAQNGTVDVTNYASASVNVQGGDDSNFANTVSRSGAITSIPSGITSIGQYAFYGCTGLTVSSLPSGVTSIGQYAFRGCSGMPLSSLPSGITLIDTYTFYGCDLLTVSTLPSGVTYIGANAFQNCPSMTSIQGSGVITTIAASSFLGSSTKPSSLRSAKFPNANITGSLSTAFGSSTAANACQQLEEADIGSVATIAANAFANCYKLETLVLRRTAGVTGLANVSALLNTPMRGYNGLTGTVYVPSSLIASYKTAGNWSTLYNDGTVTFSAIEGSEWEL